MNHAVCKADRVAAGQEVPDATLFIADRLPSFRTTREAREHFKADAATIMEALKSLPQGTRHELLVLLLQDKVCVMTIP
jgi:hypothetical protein